MWIAFSKECDLSKPNQIKNNKLGTFPFSLLFLISAMINTYILLEEYANENNANKK